MGDRISREFAKNWPIIGICIVLWTGTIILRTPTVGFTTERLFAIIITAGSLITLGVMIERLRRARQIDEEE